MNPTDQETTKTKWQAEDRFCSDKDVVFNDVEDWSNDKESKDRHDQKCHEWRYQEINHIWNNLADSFFKFSS